MGHDLIRQHRVCPDLFVRDPFNQTLGNRLLILEPGEEIIVVDAEFMNNPFTGSRAAGGFRPRIRPIESFSQN